MKYFYLSSEKILPDINNSFSLWILGIQNILMLLLEEYVFRDPIKYRDEISGNITTDDIAGVRVILL